MLGECVVQKETKTVIRLTSTVGSSARVALQYLGIDPEIMDDLASLFDLLGLSLSPDEIVEDSFQPRDDLLGSFGVGRFSDGTIGVYYSALDDVTCRQELANRLSSELVGSLSGHAGYERFYSVIHCIYSGETADLRGKERGYPQLVGDGTDAYAFCQCLARKAVENDIDGFFTTSARRKGGTCVPVFSRSTLSSPRIVSRVRVTVTDSSVTFR